MSESIEVICGCVAISRLQWGRGNHVMQNEDFLIQSLSWCIVLESIDEQIFLRYHRWFFIHSYIHSLYHPDTVGGRVRTVS